MQRQRLLQLACRRALQYGGQAQAGSAAELPQRALAEASTSRPAWAQCAWQRWQATARTLEASPGAPVLFPDHFVRLDNLRTVPGAVAERHRLGRGNGSGRGNYCGKGMKGQKSRGAGKPGLLFDGNNKSLRKFPRFHIQPSSPVVYDYINLDTIQAWVDAGKLDAHQVITMKDLRDSGAVSKTIRWGVRLLGRGGHMLKQPLHLQVSAATDGARRAIEAAGGSVTTVYYNRLGLRALLKPENFAKRGQQLPRAVRTWPPRESGRFDAVGQLPPARQPPVPALPAAAGALASA